jgi:hypothetical protein
VSWRGKTASFSVAVGTPRSISITSQPEWEAAVNTIKTGGDDQGYTLILNNPNPLNVAGTAFTVYTFGGGTGISVTVEGSGELRLTGQGGMFVLNVTHTLTIGETGGTGPTLRGMAGNNAPVVFSRGTLIFNGGIITGNTSSSSYGGGVYSSGTFTMSGGTVSGNIASGSGGGVYAGLGSLFTMSGGVVSGNIATNGSGGGVSVSDSSMFVMSGGTIGGNTASGPSIVSIGGGGVYVDGGSLFTKSGGIIHGDTDTAHTPASDENTAASGNGHAVYYYRPSASRKHDGALYAGNDISTADLSSPPWDAP